jgi:uncharacterized membrane protein
MYHPASAHFAMVLPVVASVLSVAYLISKTESMSKLSSRATLVAALAMIVVYFTGSQAGPEIFNYLSPHGKEELLEHKQLGLYLAIAMGIIAILKIAGCRFKKFQLELLATVLLLGTTLVTFAQGKDGGEIVYKYGMPFKGYIIEKTLYQAQATAQEEEECDAQVEIYEDALDSISTLNEEINEIYGAKSEVIKEEDDE